ncbi:hypothetical protein N7488_004516 [Penicillium malachiteum]|nr:hypothetical protein N7488_004516 [Penicillium malachiteum]
MNEKMGVVDDQNQVEEAKEKVNRRKAFDVKPSAPMIGVGWVFSQFLEESGSGFVQLVLNGSLLCPELFKTNGYVLDPAGR